jgi:hypothetical protein
MSGHPGGIEGGHARRRFVVANGNRGFSYRIRRVVALGQTIADERLAVTREFDRQANALAGLCAALHRRRPMWIWRSRAGACCIRISR